MWLYFPRMIGVKNSRLTALFVTLHFIFGTYVVFSFFWFKQWTSDAPVDDFMHIVVKTGTNNEAMREAERQMWRSKPCNETGHFSMLESVNFSCPRLCSTLNPRSHCISTWETASVFDGSRELFFVTSFGDTVPGGDFKDARYHLTPYAKQQEIQLQYGIQLPFLTNKLATTRRDDATELEATSGAKYDLVALSSANVTTRLLNERGHHVKTFKPSEFLSFSLSEALELAGVGDMLDAKTPSFMFDQLPSQLASYATRRFTGVEVVIRLHCRFQRKYWSMRWAEVFCDAVFLPGVLQYAGVKRILPDGSVRHYGGVRVRITTRVDAEFLDLHLVYQALVGAIVLATLPRLMVMFFANFCLGSCSKVYRSLIWERFALQEHITTAIMRWIVGFASHQVLAKEDGLISQRFLTNALRECVMKKSQGLNDEDLDALIRMCMHNVANTAYLSRRSKRHHRISQVLDSDNFSVAFLNGEYVGFDDILRLLDTTRKKHCVERFFMPRELLETGECVCEMKKMIRSNAPMTEQFVNIMPADVDNASMEGLPSTTKNDAIIVKAEIGQEPDASGCLDVNQDTRVITESSADNGVDESTHDSLRSEIFDLKVQCGLLQNALQHQVMARLDALERKVTDLWETVNSLPRRAGTMDRSATTSGPSLTCETRVSIAEAFSASLPASLSIVPKATSLEGDLGTGDITSDALHPGLDGAGATAALKEIRTNMDEKSRESLVANAPIEGLVREPQAMGAALQTSIAPTSRHTLAAGQRRAANSTRGTTARTRCSL